MSIKKISDEELLKLDALSQEYDTSGKKIKHFCKEKFISETKLKKFRLTISGAGFCSPSRHPDEYEYFILMGRECQQSEKSVPTLAKEYGISPSKLYEILRHLDYTDRLKKLKEKNDPIQPEETSTNDAPLSFVKVRRFAIKPKVIESEVLTKKNDIELAIAKGIKVMIAPEVEADKIVKIIELLKDL